jgi:hypothetical protein
MAGNAPVRANSGRVCGLRTAQGLFSTGPRWGDETKMDRGLGRDGETVLRTPEVVFRTPPPVTGRAGDVNPPVTVRARAANTAAGAHQGRTGRLTLPACHTAFS